MTTAKQFKIISRKYAAFVGTDPLRHFLYYPAILESLNVSKGKSVLDIGCGEGTLARLLAGSGAKVIGYDREPALIALARGKEEHTQLGIEYFAANARIFSHRHKFNYATSVLVLPYAEDAHSLSYFFESAYKHLERNGSFVSITVNPDFNGFGKIVANRLLEKLGDHKIRANFLDPDNQTIVISIDNMQFSRGEYVSIAKKAGFEQVNWEKLYPTTHGIKKFGRAFWNTCEREQPYILLRAEK